MWGWLPAEGEDPALWRVVHADGDEEDLEEHELLRGLVDEDGDPPVLDGYVNENAALGRGLSEMVCAQRITRPILGLCFIANTHIS